MRGPRRSLGSGLLGVLLACSGCGAGRPAASITELAAPYSPAAFESAEATELGRLELDCERGDGLACRDAARQWRDAFGHCSLEAEPANRRLEARALALLPAACEQGAGLACFALGEILADPGSRGRDPERADEHFGRARDLLPPLCERGDLEACSALAVMLGDGLGGPADTRASDERFLEALALSAARCGAGDVDLCDRHTAWWFSWIDVADERPALAHLAAARTLFSAECDRGSSRACDKLAQTYNWADLRDGSASASRARLAFQKACQLGRAGSCVEAGRLWSTGSRKRRDPMQARSYFERGCDGGDASGCIQAAELCLRSDPAVTRAFYDRACELGSATGCRRLADMLELGHGGPTDRAAARAAIQRVRDQLTPGCDFGRGLHAAEDCKRLGDLLDQGAGALGDRSAAEEAYAKARSIYAEECRAGDGFSCLVAADLTRQGLGGPADEGEADRLLQLACQTRLADDLCRDGEPRPDLEVTIEFGETTINFSY